LVACEDLKVGEVILHESPIITGPKVTSSHLCLGCYSPLPQPTKCSKCGWPVCGPRCEDAGFHKLECETLSRWPLDFKGPGWPRYPRGFGPLNPPYEAVLVLRCLHLPRDGPEWSLLMEMEFHDEERRARVQDVWTFEQRNIVEFLGQKFGVTDSEELIHRVGGVLDVNCHEIRAVTFDEAGCEQQHWVRGVYPVTAMMSHDCRPNTQHTTLDDHSLVLRAAQPIAAGAQITSTYTHLLSGTRQRRKYLRFSKFFDCACARCSDPTELGSNLSTLRCGKAGCHGNVLCTDPLHPENRAPYACDACKTVVEGDKVATLLEQIADEIQTTREGDTVALRSLLGKFTPTLHPNHYHLVEIKSCLAQAYGRTDGHGLPDLPLEAMQHKIWCCQQVLQVLHTTLPSQCRLRGILLYEQWVSKLKILRDEVASHLLPSDQTQVPQRLEAILALQRETLHCLEHEASSSFEGKAAKVTRNSGPNLRGWLAELQTARASDCRQEVCQSSEETNHAVTDDQNLTVTGDNLSVKSRPVVSKDEKKHSENNFDAPLFDQNLSLDQLLNTIDS